MINVKEESRVSRFGLPCPQNLAPTVCAVYSIQARGPCSWHHRRTAEDARTPIINGVIALGLEAVADNFGFLTVWTNAKQSATQREGRAGQTRDVLLLSATGLRPAARYRWVRATTR